MACRAASACQRFGEAPLRAAGADSLFALPLKSGPWLIAGVYPQGCDDEGRPGALAFHALFVGRWAYCWAGSSPFAFAGALRNNWSSVDQDRTLPPIWAPIHRNRPRAPDDPRSAVIVAALTQGNRVVVRSAEPVDGLARSVWCLLPHRVRRRASVATWAFDNANHFDLVASPKLAGMDFDTSDVILDIEQAGRS